MNVALLRTYLECPFFFWQTPTYPSRPNSNVPFFVKLSDPLQRSQSLPLQSPQGRIHVGFTFLPLASNTESRNPGGGGGGNSSKRPHKADLRPGTAVNTLHALSRLFERAGYYCDPHFTGEETEAQKLLVPYIS